MNTLSILIVGVGGQGTLLSSRILGKYAQLSGYDVKVSEVHGMAQRGGSVITYVRMGDEIASPIIEEGEAEYMMAFEKLEALRYIQLMKKSGQIIVNGQKIDPMPVITGTADYPDSIIDRLKNKIETFVFDAMSEAKEAGNIKAVNTVMIGKLANIMGGSKEIWLEAVRACVPPKTGDVNILAFERGYEL